MARGANRLDVLVVYSCVAKVMVVLMAARTEHPHVTAVGAGNVIGFRQQTDVDQAVNPPPSL